uniref:Uncharacterized protein n=1 Tax=Arundo donax TaxID=35708 RepID=A0A0A9EK05_ARUDO
MQNELGDGCSYKVLLPDQYLVSIKQYCCLLPSAVWSLLKHICFRHCRPGWLSLCCILYFVPVLYGME